MPIVVPEPDAHLEYRPWEAAFAVRIGFPIGTRQSVDRPVQGTRLSFNDLGLDVSESLEGNVAFAFTRHDAVRVSFLYSFLDGTANHVMASAASARTRSTRHKPR